MAYRHAETQRERQRMAGIRMAGIRQGHEDTERREAGGGRRDEGGGREEERARYQLG